jgi:hypothetical protein
MRRRVRKCLFRGMIMRLQLGMGKRVLRVGIQLYRGQSSEVRINEVSMRTGDRREVFEVFFHNGWQKMVLVRIRLDYRVWRNQR